MEALKILLADDDAVFCQLVAELLKKQGFDVVKTLDVDTASRALNSQAIDMMMLDMCFPALMDGFNLLEYARRTHPQLPILMISGSGNIPDAVRAIRMGAADYIEKPIEPEHLAVRIQNMAGLITKDRQVRQLEQTAAGMVGVSAGFQKVLEEIRVAAQYDSPVLISGETGVGKELAARAVHRLSPLGNRDLFCVNCASVPRDLFEAELFGYEKGAFTGAVSSFKGYFEFARNTSLFLDEIGELPLNVQSKLLRVLSEGEIQRVGGKIINVQTRIISATNHDLPGEVKTGSFREDLLYRLNSIEISIRPLRERPEDIPLLARHFINLFCQRNNMLPKEISPRGVVWLTDQRWKGNVRELKNLVERALIFSRREILEPEDFLRQPEEEHADTAELGTLRDSLHQYEKRLIELHLKTNRYNISQTAKFLGVDKSNLSKRIRQLGIFMPDPQGQ